MRKMFFLPIVSFYFFTLNKHNAAYKICYKTKKIPKSEVRLRRNTMFLDMPFNIPFYKKLAR